MSKYIDADLLRKDIEFAKSVYSNPKRVVHGVADAFRQDGRAAMCDDILKKLDSIPEQPIKGLEEAATKYAHSLGYDEEKERLEIASAKDDFIAGAKYQRKQDQSLIELAEDRAMLAGMNKMKEQMMEKAIEGKVFMSFAPGHNQVVMADVDLPTNTKVKVIIVKEDE